MRVLAVIAVAMLLAGCEGDRIKQSKNPPQDWIARLDGSLKAVTFSVT